jgi:hypothetical protein
MKKISSAALVVAMLVAGASTASANLLKNPGFEDPTIDTGSALGKWFRFGSGAAGFANQNGTMPRSGAQAVELTTVAAQQFAGVFQTLESPTTPGTPLAISPGQTVVFTGWNKAVGDFFGTRELKIEWTGAPTNRVDSLVMGSAYEQFSHSAVAPPGTTGATITYAISTFGPNQGDANVFIDDFSVTVIPEPATVGLAGLALVGLVRMRRK